MNIVSLSEKKEDIIPSNLDYLSKQEILNNLNKTRNPEDWKEYNGHFDDSSHPGEYDIYERNVNEKDLLNKPHMTEKDKKAMIKTIELMKTENMFNQENINKLNAIIYTKEYVEIGGVKRAREDIKTHADGKNVYEHGNMTYIKMTEETIREQKALLDDKGMEIPYDKHFEKSMQALPGKYDYKARYVGGNILAIITDMGLNGFYDNGSLIDDTKKGYRRMLASADKDAQTLNYRFNNHEGNLKTTRRPYAMPIRPVFK